MLKPAPLWARPVSEPPGAPAKAPSVAQAARSSAAPADAGYLINVGLFAQASNARNAMALLSQAHLPAHSQALQSANGVLTRVRSGPFQTPAQAQRAARTIHALGLEAQIIHVP